LLIITKLTIKIFLIIKSPNKITSKTTSVLMYLVDYTAS